MVQYGYNKIPHLLHTAYTIPQRVTGVPNVWWLRIIKQAKCHQCGKLGHLRKVCRSKQKSKGQDKREPWDQLGFRWWRKLNENMLDSILCTLLSVEFSPHWSLWNWTATMVPFSWKLVVSEATFKELWPSRVLPPCDIGLCSYSGEPIQVLGCLSVMSPTNPNRVNCHSLWWKGLAIVFVNSFSRFRVQNEFIDYSYDMSYQVSM